MTVVILLWLFNIAILGLGFRKPGASRNEIAVGGAPLSLPNRFRRSVYASSKGFSGALDTGAETVSIADDSAVDNADDALKFWASLEPELEEELEFPEDAELQPAKLDEL